MKTSTEVRHFFWKSQNTTDDATTWSTSLTTDRTRNLIESFFAKYRNKNQSLGNHVFAVNTTEKLGSNPTFKVKQSWTAPHIRFTFIVGLMDLKFLFKFVTETIQHYHLVSYLKEFNISGPTIYQYATV